MNAPLQRDTRTLSLLRAAIGVLELRYRQQGSACLALLICRHYRLLAGEEQDPARQPLWRLAAEHWMQIYQRYPQRGKGLSRLSSTL